MNITWHGQANYTIKGSQTTIVIDPFAGIGLTEPKLSADILLISHGHKDHSNAEGVSGDPYVIDVAGEYESHGVMVEGIPTYHDDKQGAERGPNIVFSVIVDGFHLVHCGDLGHQLDDPTLERIGNVDILFIPVGGQYTIDAKTAVEVVKKIQPRVTIPMHYKVPGLTLSKELDPVDAFLKEAGQTPQNLETPTWKIKRVDLPEEESQIIVFPNP